MGTRPELRVIEYFKQASTADSGVTSTIGDPQALIPASAASLFRATPTADMELQTLHRAQLIDIQKTDLQAGTIPGHFAFNSRCFRPRACTLSSSCRFAAEHDGGKLHAGDSKHSIDCDWG